MDQIDTIERSRTKLTHDVNVRDHLCNLPFLLREQTM